MNKATIGNETITTMFKMATNRVWMSGNANGLFRVLVPCAWSESGITKILANNPTEILFFRVDIDFIHYGVNSPIVLAIIPEMATAPIIRIPPMIEYVRALVARWVCSTFPWAVTYKKPA